MENLSRIFLLGFATILKFCINHNHKNALHAPLRQKTAFHHLLPSKKNKNLQVEYPSHQSPRLLAAAPSLTSAKQSHPLVLADSAAKPSSTTSLPANPMAMPSSKPSVPADSTSASKANSYTAPSTTNELPASLIHPSRFWFGFT
jgi:hypothetical protein